MKRIVMLLVGVVVAAVAYSQTTPVARANGPVISWEKPFHDFGQIQPGDKVEYTYHFTNTGNEPLMITNVTVTCGCTTPKGWPHDPIEPGQKGELIVAFDSTGKPSGKIDKVITVISNAVNPEGGQVKFTTRIAEKKDPQ